MMYIFWQHTLKPDLSLSNYLKAQSISTPLFVFARGDASPSDSNCPIAFTDVTSDYQGRYIRIVNSNSNAINQAGQTGGTDKPTYRVPVQYNDDINLSVSTTNNNGIHGIQTLPTQNIGAGYRSANRSFTFHSQNDANILTANNNLTRNLNSTSPERDVLIPLICNGNFNCVHPALNHDINITTEAVNNVGRYDNNPNTSTSVATFNDFTERQKEFRLPRKSFRLCRWGI